VVENSFSIYLQKLFEVNYEKSRILTEMQSTGNDLYDSEIIDKVTMQNFDVSGLKNINELNPSEIKSIRNKEHVGVTREFGLFSTLRNY
jgi:DNA-binding transcriptional regulator YiaG